MFNVSDGRPKCLSCHFVVHALLVNTIHEVLDVARIFANEIRNDRPEEHRNVIFHILGFRDTDRAICRASTDEILLPTLQELDGLNLDRLRKELVQIEDGLVVLGRSVQRLAGILGAKRTGK